MLDPVVIDPPNFDQRKAWGEMDPGPYVYENGEPNWQAAFGADPGCCSCPACHEYYWAWGRIQRCVKCGFEYPTDWWCGFSWGAQEARERTPEQQANRDAIPYFREKHELWMTKNKYYRWAYENKAEPKMEAAESLPWREIFPEDCKDVPPTTEPVPQEKGQTNG